jgi:hypothetical protein
MEISWSQAQTHQDQGYPMLLGTTPARLRTPWVGLPILGTPQAGGRDYHRENTLPPSGIWLKRVLELHIFDRSCDLSW